MTFHVGYMPLKPAFFSKNLTKKTPTSFRNSPRRQHACFRPKKKITLLPPSWLQPIIYIVPVLFEFTEVASQLYLVQWARHVYGKSKMARKPGKNMKWQQINRCFLHFTSSPCFESLSINFLQTNRYCEEFEYKLHNFCWKIGENIARQTLCGVITSLSLGICYSE